MFYALRVAQMSFFSADARTPRIADLAGVLCGHGQIATFAAAAARLTVTVDDPWRARLLLGELAARGVSAGVHRLEEGGLQLRTAFRSDLIGLARHWCQDGVKTVPGDLRLDGPVLRLWALCSGRRVHDGPGTGDYLFGLDPGARDCHQPLITAVRELGLLSASKASAGPRAGGPAIRVTGVRRMRGLAELMGARPPGAESIWPDFAVPVPAA